jgi:hypothetical protein
MVLSYLGMSCSGAGERASQPPASSIYSSVRLFEFVNAMVRYDGEGDGDGKDRVFGRARATFGCFMRVGRWLMPMPIREGS